MANPFVHVELSTTDVGKAKAFYGKLFDWKLEDIDMGPMGTYTIIKVGEGEPAAGSFATNDSWRGLCVDGLCPSGRHRRGY